MCFNVYATYMGSNGDDISSPRLQLTLTPTQDRYLADLVDRGRYLSKQDAVRALINKEMVMEGVLA